MFFALGDPAPEWEISISLDRLYVKPCVKIVVPKFTARCDELESGACFARWRGPLQRQRLRAPTVDKNQDTSGGTRVRERRGR